MDTASSVTLHSPKERFYRVGVEGLSLDELLSLILGRGSVSDSIVHFLSRGTSFNENLNQLSFQFPQRKCESHLFRLFASIELGRRFEKMQSSIRLKTISNHLDVANLMKPYVRSLSHERFWILSLNTRNRILGVDEVARGNPEGVTFTLRDAFRMPLLRQASRMISVHNHPSGEVAPSREDRLLTDQMKTVAHLLGIQFLDHVIVGPNGESFSWSERVPQK